MKLRTVGVEEELLVVDPVNGRATPRFADLEHTVRDRHGRDQELVEHEFKQEQAEIASAPFIDLGLLGEDLRDRRAALASAAAIDGLAVAAIASSPLPVTPTPTPDERYREMQARFGLLARQQLTCGAHVHVAIADRDEGIAALDRIRPWLSVLLALSANSPYWQGEDTGYASYRAIVWNQWPTAGPTGTFADVATYDGVVAALVESGTILDVDMVYFDARLSAHYPTVEIRVADVCSDLDDAVLLAALARALVQTAIDQARDGALPSQVRTELLRVATWRAARTGMAEDLVLAAEGGHLPAADVVDRLVDATGPALRAAGDDAMVRTALDAILRRGTGADRQRERFTRSRDLRDVVLDAIERTATS